MFLLHGDAEYIDVLERPLYNSVISGVSLGGKEFFYPNRLSSGGDEARSTWFDCSCCPTNLCRFIPSVPGYAYAVGDDGPYVNLFVEGDAKLEVDGKQVRIEQKTRYPWDGTVEIEITPEAAGQEFALHLRIPGWSRGEAWPSDLYSYLGESTEKPKLAVNGKAMAIEPVKGYAVVKREWQAGDKVTLTLPMPVRRVIANEKVVADRGRVALMRGPMVFCVEGVDVAGGKVSDLVLPDDAPLSSGFRKDLLGGVEVITGEAKIAVADKAETTVPLTAVPYYSWANRGKSEMAVWLARTPQAIESVDPADKE
jgi:DUF1680 family protein